MDVFPARDASIARLSAGQPILLHTRLVMDLETPVSSFLKLYEQGKHGILLESVHGGESRGRYSIIALEPDQIWTCKGNRSWLKESGGNERELPYKPLDALRHLLKTSHIDIPPELPPMACGWFGYLGYDMVRLMERLPEPREPSIDVPDAVLIRPSVILVFDTVADSLFIIAPLYPDGMPADACYTAGIRRIEDIIRRLSRQLMGHRVYGNPAKEALSFQASLKEGEYEGMVEKAKEYILAGDIFQVVLSQRYEAEYYLPHFAFYRALRHLNPSPFLFYLGMEDFSLVGSSPEVLVRLRNNEVTIRPIAGTRKRGATPEEDLALEKELLADPKERSEHLMLLDLGRNDVGRVSKPGTVTVTEQMVIERYSHVMHIVSDVRGELDTSKHDAVDAMMAGFPAGTVSGAPKIRAMEIIDELETVKREFYGGCVGYFGTGGTLDTCLTIRTALIKNNRIYAHAGAGIVADSVPESERQECENKARAMMVAARQAELFQ